MRVRSSRRRFIDSSRHAARPAGQALERALQPLCFPAEGVRELLVGCGAVRVDVVPDLEVFLDTAASLPGVPLASTTTEGARRGRALGPIWRRPAPSAPEPRSPHYLAWGDTLSERRAGNFR